MVVLSLNKKRHIGGSQAERGMGGAWGSSLHRKDSLPKGQRVHRALQVLPGSRGETKLEKDEDGPLGLFRRSVGRWWSITG